MYSSKNVVIYNWAKPQIPTNGESCICKTYEWLNIIIIDNYNELGLSLYYIPLHVSIGAGYHNDQVYKSHKINDWAENSVLGYQQTLLEKQRKVLSKISRS